MLDELIARVQAAAGSEEKKRAKRTLKKVEKEISNIMAAIRAGIITPTT